MKGQQHNSKLPVRPNRAALTPVAQDIRPIHLETGFLEEPVHHRWLLTTCLAGAAATLVVGGLMLGLFGHNAAPQQANAAISSTETAGAPGKKKPAATETDLTAATSPADSKTEVLPERELAGDWAYPEISQNELAYNDDDTSVLDAEIEAVESERENITEISKTPPPEPVDETFKLAKGSSLKRELIDRGVSEAAAAELVRAIEPAWPTRNIKPGTAIEVTFDRQIDFYGREVIFPVDLSFKPNPTQTVEVTADEDGNFAVEVQGKAEVAAVEPDKPKPAAEHFRARSRIGTSLYGTAKDNKIPDYIVAEFTRVFSYDVDFQHQIAASDDFELLFGKPLTGSSSKRKVLHYAQLNFGGKTKKYFRFTTA